MARFPVGFLMIWKARSSYTSFSLTHLQPDIARLRQQHEEEALPQPLRLRELPAPPAPPTPRAAGLLTNQSSSDGLGSAQQLHEFLTHLKSDSLMTTRDIDAAKDRNNTGCINIGRQCCFVYIYKIVRCNFVQSWATWRTKARYAEQQKEFVISSWFDYRLREHGEYKLWTWPIDVVPRRYLI